jgi:phage FluMu protein Com
MAAMTCTNCSKTLVKASDVAFIVVGGKTYVCKKCYETMKVSLAATLVVKSVEKAIAKGGLK